jgi:hypothetical protein
MRFYKAFYYFIVLCSFHIPTPWPERFIPNFKFSHLGMVVFAYEAIPNVGAAAVLFVPLSS